MNILNITDTHYKVEHDSIHREFFAKLPKKGFDIILHTGDIGTSTFLQRQSYLTMLRDYTSKPIFVTWGNHDYWNHKGLLTWDKALEENNELAARLGIQVLEGRKSFELDDVFLTGFGGWYSDIDAPTNDQYHILDYKLHFSEMATKSYTEFESCLEALQKAKNEGKTTVLATHFEFFKALSWSNIWMGNNPKYAEQCENIDYIIFGHTHAEFDDVLPGHPTTHCINVGSFIGKPKFRILKIPQ